MSLSPIEIEKFKARISSWQPNPDEQDKRMIACYAKDRKQLNEVLALVKKGLYAEAGEKAMFLDTIVRDRIPNSVYDMITTRRTP